MSASCFLKVIKRVSRFVGKEEEMKKIGLILAVVVVGTFMLAGTAKALPFDSSGWVDPNYGDSWDSNTLFGTARYYFYWDNQNVSVTELDLQFEGDIFNLDELDTSDFNVIGLSDWSTSIHEESDTLYWSISSGTGIDYTQDPIILDAQYTLLSSSRYSYGNNTYASETEEWGWNEAQGANTAWVQKYTLTGTGYISGGSTAPVPEPTSLLLFGTGLLGLAGFAIARRKRS